MLVPLLVASLMTVGCRLAPEQKPAVAEKVPQADPFPVPKEGISIKVGKEDKTSLEDMLNEFSRVTGQNLLMSNETRQDLAHGQTGLNRNVEVPPQEVYFYVESILVQHDFALSILSDREPRLLGVRSLAQNNGARGSALKNDAISVPGNVISVWARHPAFLVTTSIDMPHTDVRTLSNSMRTMFTNAATQQIVPVGNSNTLIITDFGPQLASLVKMLMMVDDAARLDEERMKREETQKPAPKEPAPK